MSWVKVDDKAWCHPKFLSLSGDAVRLWMFALCWSGSQGTDGAIPRAALRLLGGTQDDAQELVEARLWEETDNGWTVRGYLDYQPSAEAVRKRRELRAAAGRAGGKRSGEVRSGNNSHKAQTELLTKAEDVDEASDEAKSKQTLKQNRSTCFANRSALLEANANPEPEPEPEPRGSPPTPPPPSPTAHAVTARRCDVDGSGQSDLTNETPVSSSPQSDMPIPGTELTVDERSECLGYPTSQGRENASQGANAKDSGSEQKNSPPYNRHHPCPPDLELNEGEIAQLRLGVGMTEEFIRRATPQLRAKFLSDEPRTLPRWRRTLIAALIRSWSDPAQKKTLMGISTRKTKPIQDTDPSRTLSEICGFDVEVNGKLA